jgi:hypothetical protein
MSAIGKYIYGIIPNPDGLKNLSELEQYDLHTISYQDITAVVKDAEMVECEMLRRDELARLLVKHQEMIETVMGLGYTIIPMRLGTYAVDGREVNAILRKGYRLIKDILGKIQARIEIDIVATWTDFASVLKSVGAEKAIVKFKTQLLAQGQQITVEDQKNLGMMVKQALDRRASDYAYQIHTALKTVSQDLKVHDVMDDQMIMNTAFLINASEREDFDQKLAELDANFDEIVNFRCVGPLPSYSFYTLEIERLEFGDIYWAKNKLGLQETATPEDIKRAYQAKAFSSHPDQNPNLPGIDEEFEEVKEAYTILVNYCLAVEQGTQEAICSFREEDFEQNAIVVKVKK